MQWRFRRIANCSLQQAVPKSGFGKSKLERDVRPFLLSPLLCRVNWLFYQMAGICSLEIREVVFTSGIFLPGNKYVVFWVTPDTSTPLPSCLTQNLSFLPQAVLSIRTANPLW